MKPVLSIGFRRSGNHLLIETIRKNFDVPISRYKCAHIAPDLHALRLLKDAYTLFYIYRDWTQVEPSLKKFYLSGRPQKWDHPGCPQIDRMLENPKKAWQESVDYFTQQDLYTLRYEDLVAEPEVEILKIHDHFGWPLIHGEPVRIRKKVGP